MAGHGGARPGSGRPKGSREAATKAQQATIGELARQHAASALQALVQIATAGESESARVAASNSILDRAYGKPVQGVELTGKDGGPIQHEDVTVERLIAEATRLGLDPAALGISQSAQEEN